MDVFSIVLGSTWYNGLLVNESASEVRPQPTEFGIQWYVFSSSYEVVSFVRYTYSGVYEGTSAMERENAKGIWSGQCEMRSMGN